MHLIDIPLELFQQIARDVVEVAAITGAWKLRGVCRSFAAEIPHDIFFKRTTAEFTGCSQTRFLMPTMDRYLAARLPLPLDVDQLLLDKIQSMVDWATTEMDGNTKSDKDDAAENVCTGLLNVVGGSNLVYPIIHESRDERKNLTRWAEQDLGIHDKLVAALGVGSYELINTLLPRLLEKPQEVFWLAFDPFTIAIRKNDMTLFQITLRILQKVAATDATRLVSIQQIQVPWHPPFARQYGIRSWHGFDSCSIFPHRLLLRAFTARVISTSCTLTYRSGMYEGRPAPRRFAQLHATK